MTQEQEYSYLDLSVLTPLRPYVLSADAAAVFDENLESILWANAAGANLLGGRGIADLLSARLSDSLSFVRQLKNAIAQLEVSDGSLIRGFRVSQGVRTRLLQCEISRIVLPENVAAILLVCSDNLGENSVTENDLAHKAVNALEGFADAAAIIDDFGLPLAVSEKFEDIGLSESALEMLVDELTREEDRLIKRPVVDLPEGNFVAGLARFSDNPGRNLLVLADTTITSEDEDTDAGNDTEPAVAADTTDLGAEILHSEAFNGKVTIVDDSPDSESAVVQQETYDSDTAYGEAPLSQPHLMPVNEESEQKKDTNNLAERTRSLLDRWAGQEHSPDGEEIDSADTPESADSMGVQGLPKEFQFEESSQTVRFAFTIDADGIFQSISPELSQSVGPNSADVEGRSWADVSTVFGFDRNGEIKNLLEKQDTWSGKTVLWPIQGTDLSVPIDLAALPVFDAERRFEGFRGFGIIRMPDTLLDPEETGLALAGSTTEAGEFAGTPNEPEDTLSTIPDTELITPEDEPIISIASEIGSEDQDSDKSNVVKLVHKNTNPSEQEGELPVDTSLLEKLPVAVLVYRSGETLFANRQLLSFTGYRNTVELADAGGIDALFNLVPAADTGQSDFQQMILKDGTERNVKPVLHTVPWSGQKALLLSFMPEVELGDEPPVLAIAEASEVQNILDISSDGILVLEPTGNIVSINASAEALFGVTFDDMSGKPISDLMALESREVIEGYIADVSAPGVGPLLNDGREVIGHEAKGGLIPLFVTISRLQSSGMLCAVVRDMTNWKNAEEELIKARRGAELANEQKSEFLAHVSHEIRTPLNSIIGFSQVMIEEKFGPVENERYREYLRDISRSGNHVLDLINDLLDLSKIEAGKLELSFEAIDLNQLVSETVALLQPEANAHRIIIRTSLSRAVPKVVADTRSMRQIILNLVSNGIKYSPPSGQVIVSTVYESNGEVALRIRDTGRGMSEDEIEDAMKPFQQVHGVSEKRGQGTGLGLPLTKALVEANRAYFDLESGPDQGTIAHVQFPTQRVLAD